MSLGNKQIFERITNSDIYARMYYLNHIRKFVYMSISNCIFHFPSVNFILFVTHLNMEILSHYASLNY